MKKRNLFLAIVVLLIAGGIWWLPIFKAGQHAYYSAVYRRSLNAPHNSRIEVVSFYSKALKQNRELRVYVPNAYDGGGKFPVLYLLHGYPGSDSDWLINTDLQSQLDGLITARKLPPLLVVFPDGNGKTIPDSQYVNAVKVDQNMETFIAEDAVGAIDSRYRTISDRRGRAIGGLSSGGYGAMNIGLKHNAEFAYIISESGYFINRERVASKLFGQNAQAQAANNPLDYLPNLPLARETYIYFSIGSRDKKEYIQDNQRLDQELSKKQIFHQFAFDPNERHGWGYWHKAVPDFLEFLGQRLTAGP